ncbi:MAG: Fic family protein [Aeriscardovia sp.]|nr:Fic family protein [Aeriscardovia sp.]
MSSEDPCPIYVDEASLDSIVEEIRGAHAAALESGGLPLDREMDGQAVSPVVYAAFASGREFPTIYEQIAFFAVHLSTRHAFADGNKRTTVRASLGLLKTSGIDLDIDDSADPMNNELYKMIEAVVCERMDYDQLAGFFREHARKR